MAMVNIIKPKEIKEDNIIKLYNIINKIFKGRDVFRKEGENESM